MRMTLGILLTSMAAWAQAIPIASLETKKLDATAATYQGKQATCLSDREGGGGLALLKGSVFKNGVIEVELAGKPSAGAFAGARGFVGIAFRAQRGGPQSQGAERRLEVRVHLSAAHQRPGRRHGAPQPFDAVHLRTRLALGPPAQRVAGR